MTRWDKIHIAVLAVSFSAAIAAVGSEVINDLHQINHRTASRAVPAGKWQHTPGFYEFDQIAKANP